MERNGRREVAGSRRQAAVCKAAARGPEGGRRPSCTPNGQQATLYRLGVPATEQEASPQSGDLRKPRSVGLCGAPTTASMCLWRCLCSYQACRAAAGISSAEHR